MRWLPIFAIFFTSVLANEPARADLFSCSEQGILGAIVQGGGPHTFDCAGPTTVVASSTVFIENDVILDGEGHLTMSGGDRHPVLIVEVGATVELHNLTISNGLASFSYPCCDGGGIRNRGNLTLVGCRVSENSAAIGGGGGIFNSAYISGGQTSLVIIDSTVSNNSAVLGGGISHVAGATLVLDGSTVSENESTSDDPLIRGGGGIFSNSDLRIMNSTVSSNSASFGGGISQQKGHLSLTNVTLSGNSPNEVEVAGPVEVTNTIFDGPCAGQLVTSLGGNLESPGDTCGHAHPSDQAGVSDLLLGALADNGGPSDTHALLPGSAAIDAGVDCPPPATDQRGAARPVGAACDIGAVEYLSEVPTATPTPTPTPTPIPVPLTKDQQACVNEMNKNGEKVNKAQLKENEWCLNHFQRENLDPPMTFDTCTTADNRGRAQRAEERTVTREGKKCDSLVVPPPFAYTDSETINAAGVNGALRLLYQIFGGPPVLDTDLITKANDIDTANCQREMLKRADKLENTVLREFNKAKKRALMDETVDNKAALGDKLRVVLSSNDRIERTQDQLVSGVDRKCNAVLAPPSTIFPGGCANPDLSVVEDCVITAARCEACLKINVFDDLDLDCDQEDDRNNTNESCP